MFYKKDSVIGNHRLSEVKLVSLKLFIVFADLDYVQEIERICGCAIEWMVTLQTVAKNIEGRLVLMKCEIRATQMRAEK